MLIVYRSWTPDVVCGEEDGLFEKLKLQQCTFSGLDELKGGKEVFDDVRKSLDCNIHHFHDRLS